jgi:hypothetical protein
MQRIVSSRCSHTVTSPRTQRGCPRAIHSSGHSRATRTVTTMIPTGDGSVTRWQEITLQISVSSQRPHQKLNVFDGPLLWMNPEKPGLCIGYRYRIRAIWRSASRLLEPSSPIGDLGVHRKEWGISRKRKGVATHVTPSIGCPRHGEKLIKVVASQADGFSRKRPSCGRPLRDCPSPRPVGNAPRDLLLIKKRLSDARTGGYLWVARLWIHIPFLVRSSGSSVREKSFRIHRTRGGDLVGK